MRSSPTHRIRSIRAAIMAALMALPAASPALAQEAALPSVREAGEDFPVSPPASVANRRFYLSVPENRADPKSNTIELPVAVLTADDNSGAPVVMLTGGPGTAGLGAAQYPGAYPWVGKRPFVLIGQRGTRHASPALMCEAYEAALQEGAGPDRKLDAVKTCAREAQASGVDLAAYNTAESARDLEDLRRALGAEKLTLYGLSYGTRLALAYARQFPDRVEALVLDSPLPFAADYDRELPASVEATLEAIATRCSQQAECNARYPDLWLRFWHAMKRRAAAAPTKGAPSAADIALYIAPGSAEDIANAPALMEAAARADLAPFPTGGGSGSSGFAWGMRLSVWCSESGPRGPVASPFAGINAPTFAEPLCEAWPVPARPAGELADPEGDAFPVLILAGELDVLTPPSWGERLLAKLGRARLITVPAGLHGVTTNWGGTGCAMRIADRFIAEPETVLGGPEPACLAEEPYPAFTIVE